MDHVTSPRDGVAVSRAPRARPAERSVLPSVRGIRWWYCVLVALVATAVGTTIDVLDLGTVGIAFLIAYPLGSLLAAAAARRDELFVPMVQPPLVVALVVPAVVAATGSLPSSGGLASVLAVAGPLISGFPAMAVTTTACLALGGARIALQRAAQPPPGHRPTRRLDATRAARAGDRDRDRRGTPPGGSGPGRAPTRPVPPAAASMPTEPAPRAPVAGSDEEPARRSPLVLPPEDDDAPRSRPPRAPGGGDDERRRRVREERMRVDRMREERRREDRRRGGGAREEESRDADRREDRGTWGPRRRPDRPDR